MNKADYEFKATNSDTFELSITLEVTGRIMPTIINKVHKAIRQKTGQFPQHGKIEELLDKHILPPENNRLIHTLCKPILNQIYTEVEKDGIKIIRDEPTKVVYYKKENKWHIDLNIEGTYSK